jgi:hypothetical protein
MSRRTHTAEYLAIMSSARESAHRQALEHKAHTTYGVFPHSDGRGFVAREMHNDRAPFPYAHVSPVRVFRNRSRADRLAEQLSGLR